MKLTTNNPRQLAVETLVKTSTGSYSNLQINAVIEASQMGNSDKNLYTNIVYGVIQHRLTLEYELNSYLKPNQQLDDWVRELLYTAIYQMQYLDRVPKRAIFDESIKIAKTLGHDGVRRFVTGMLHQIDRQGLPDLTTIKDELVKKEVTYSVPGWLIELLESELGESKTQAILESLNEPSKQSVRYNPRKITKEQLMAELVAEGYEVQPSLVAADGLIITKGHILDSKWFKEGYVTIQDESAMLPVEVMNVQADDQILDACSAPGGKTTQIAGYLDEALGGQVTALDIHQNKLKHVIKNAKRMGVNGAVKTLALDARKVADQFNDGQFDQILVDAPCSGLGLMRKKPEIRYEKTLADIQRLSQIQTAILDAVAAKVKAGGTLVYSTCTITKLENEDVVTDFLKNHPEFELATPMVTNDLGTAIDNDMIKIYPDDFKSDGFFVCRLTKKI